MKNKIVVSLAAAALMASLATPDVQARGNDLTISTGKGEEISIKNGFFGRNSKVVKDRMGNKIETKSGLFGTGENEVRLLGNSYSKKKGLFGGSKTQVTSLFGDSVTTEKGVFGRRKTRIEMGGMSGLIGNLISSKTASGNAAKGLESQQPGSIPGTGLASPGLFPAAGNLESMTDQAEGPGLSDLQTP